MTSTMRLNKRTSLFVLYGKPGHRLFRILCAFGNLSLELLVQFISLVFVARISLFVKLDRVDDCLI